MKKAVFFDVDDTLYDHLIPFQKAIEHLVEEQKQPFPFEQAYHRMRYYSDMLSLQLGGAGKMEAGDSTAYMQRKRFQLALQEFNIEMNEAEAEEVQQKYLACQFDIECFDGALQLIDDLQRQGVVVGILTNGATAHQWKKIKALQIDKHVPPEHIFVSGTYGIDKPNPEIFQIIMKSLSLDPQQCTYIGDSWRNDVKGATAAKWDVIWFNHRKQSGENAIVIREASNYVQLRHYLLV